MTNKKNVLFVGSFKAKSKSGHVGGQMFACRTLISSSIKSKVNFITLDTTASTNRKRSALVRLFNAIPRYIAFSYSLITKKVDAVLIFSSSGFSFIEKGSMIMLAKVLGKKTIFAPRSGHLIDNFNSSKRYRSFGKKVFAASDHIICQGSFWKSYFREKFSLPNQKLEVIHNWIKIEPKPTQGKTKDANLRVLFLGWVDVAKGIFELLEAAKILVNENIHFIIGGSGNSFEDAEKYISDNNLRNVDLKGWILSEQKDSLFTEVDLLILPTYREGLPNTILEAMMYELPVIATDVGAIPDIVSHKENGYIIKPKSVSDIVDALEFYNSNRILLESHGKQARKTIVEKNSIENAVSKFEKIIYNEV